MSRLTESVRVSTSGSVSSGSVDVSSLTVNFLPRLSIAAPGRSITNVPSGPEIASPMTSPASSSTVKVTPSTGAWGDSRRSQIRPRIEIMSSSVGSAQLAAGGAVGG